MNIVERSLRAVDGAQQGHRIPAFAFAVNKKFGDDRGSQLAALLTYYGFMALFPALLVATTVLGYIGNKAVTGNVVGDALQQFPVVGDQLGKQAAHPLTGNVVALVLGLLGLVYGMLGLAQVAQHAMAQVWNVRGVDRPGYLPRLARGLLFFVAVGIGAIGGSAISGLVTLAGQAWWLRVPVLAGEVVVNAAVYLAVFRILTPKEVATANLVPGAVVGGVAWTILLTVGTSLVQHQLQHSQALYGTFALVLGLLWWLYLSSQVALYAAEINVVLEHRLWPRSILQPPLTPADERVLAALAQQEERRPEQQVAVGFTSDDTPHEPGEVSSHDEPHEPGEDGVTLPIEQADR